MTSVAAAIRAAVEAEREACAARCSEIAAEYDAQARTVPSYSGCHDATRRAEAAARCARELRARGNVRMP